MLNMLPSFYNPAAANSKKFQNQVLKCSSSTERAAFKVMILLALFKISTKRASEKEVKINVKSDYHHSKLWFYYRGVSL